MSKIETGIRIGIRTMLRQVGYAVWDMEQNRPTRQTAGFPDLVAIGRGQVLFIECKSPKGTLSPGQIVFRDECLANGGTWFCWRSVLEARAFLVRRGIVEIAS